MRPPKQQQRQHMLGQACHWFESLDEELRSWFTKLYDIPLEVADKLRHDPSFGFPDFTSIILSDSDIDTTTFPERGFWVFRRCHNKLFASQEKGEDWDLKQKTKEKEELKEEVKKENLFLRGCDSLFASRIATSIMRSIMVILEESKMHPPAPCHFPSGMAGHRTGNASQENPAGDQPQHGSVCHWACPPNLCRVDYPTSARGVILLCDHCRGKPRYVHGARIVPGKDNEEEDGKLSNPSWRKTATDWACAPNFPP